MRQSILLSLLLGAGALSHPHYKLNNPLPHFHLHGKRDGPSSVQEYNENGVHVVEDIYVQTVVAQGPSPVAVNEDLAQNKVYVKPTAQPQHYWHHHHHSVPQNIDQVVGQQPKAPVVPETPKAAAPAPPAPAPPTTPTKSSTGSGDNSPLSAGKSYLTTANFFRKLQGFPDLGYDDTLSGNANKTNADDGGNVMVHELNAGSNAQCLAEGDDHTSSGDLSPFDLIWLGWLCEIPDPTINDMCSKMEAATHMQVNTGDPGHANILRNPEYKTFGCGFKQSTSPQPNFEGIWACDFALGQSGGSQTS